MPRTAALKDSAPPQLSHERHRPEKTLLYRIIDRYYPEFRAYMSEQGRSLPYHVQKEFEEYLKCGRLEHGFLRVQCSTCHHERLVAFSCTNSRRFRRTTRFLSQLRRQAHGRKCSPVGRRSPSSCADAPMGAEFPFSTEVPVRQSPRTDGQSAGYRLPSNCFPPHQKGRTDSENGKNRCCFAYSAVRTVRRPGCIKLESERGPVHFHMLSWMAYIQKTNRERQDSNAPWEQISKS